MQRDAHVVYVARDKAPGVPHHAKAGNINNALLKSGTAHGEFILVLDSDMIVHPDFLMRTLGHFYWQPECFESGCHGCIDGRCQSPKAAAGLPAACQPRWVLKEKAAFVQTPQVRFA